MSSPVKSAASVLLISLLGVPMSYIVNSAQTLQGNTGMLVAGIICLAIITALIHVALAGIKQPKDWLFYGKQVPVWRHTCFLEAVLLALFLGEFMLCNKFLSYWREAAETVCCTQGFIVHIAGTRRHCHIEPVLHQLQWLPVRRRI